MLWLIKGNACAAEEVCPFEVPPPMAADGFGDPVAWNAKRHCDSHSLFRSGLHSKLRCMESVDSLSKKILSGPRHTCASDRSNLLFLEMTK